MKRVTSAAIGLLLAGCTPWPVEGCYQFVDALAVRLVECGYASSYDDAFARVHGGLITLRSPHGCDDVERILEPGLWFDECIPRVRARPCAELGELPNACRGQLVFRRRWDP